MKPRREGTPAVAILAVNEGTEMTDFLLPRAVLQRSGIVDVQAVASHCGLVSLYPVLRLSAAGFRELQLDRALCEIADRFGRARRVGHDGIGISPRRCCLRRLNKRRAPGATKMNGARGNFPLGMCVDAQRRQSVWAGMVEKECESSSEAAPPPFQGARQAVQSELEFISLQIDGETYGGWYRLLADGQMELLALANRHSERRPERTPVEQARGMLTDFIRSARHKRKIIRAVESNDVRALGTLGALLYADESKVRVSEQEWIELVQSMARGDQLALYSLFERAHSLVFTSILQITNKRQTAEALTLDVFHTLWREAPHYQAADGTVLGWIMNAARNWALDAVGTLKEQGSLLRHALDVLGVDVQPTDVLRPSEHLWVRLAQRISAESGEPPFVPAGPMSHATEPQWEEVAPGISCKLLATDTDGHRVSMLVRLAPGVEYPPHTHAGREELHLLDGELLIDDRKLYPGDYNRAEPGSTDTRVFSETGCTCVLMTSTKDVVG